MTDTTTEGTAPAPEGTPQPPPSDWDKAKAAWRSWSPKQKKWAVLGGAVALMIPVAMCSGSPTKDRASDGAATSVTEAASPAKPSEAPEPSPEPSSEAPAPAPETTEPSPAALPQDVIDGLFIEHVERAGITVADRTNTIALGHGICASIDEGHGLGSIGGMLMRDLGMDASKAGSFMGLAVAAYCPEHKSIFEQ